MNVVSGGSLVQVKLNIVVGRMRPAGTFANPDEMYGGVTVIGLNDATGNTCVVIDALAKVQRAAAQDDE